MNAFASDAFRDGATGPFAPIMPEEMAAAAEGVASSPNPTDKVPIVPVPDDAPPCLFRDPEWGDPSGLWRYRDAEGRLFGYLVRYDVTNKEGKPDKNFRPFTYCRLKDGRHAWRAKGLPAPRPIYRLPELLADPLRPVLVVEGEKTVEAAAVLFPAHAVTTAMNGAQSPHLSDWGPLKGREVTVWPDNDAPGLAFTAKVAHLAHDAGAASVRQVRLPESLPTHWDLADEAPDGLDTGALLARAQPWRPDGQAPGGAGEASGEGWGEPELDITEPRSEPPPPLQLRLFGRYWSDFITAAAEAKGAPPDYVAGALLASAGALLGNVRRASPWLGWAEPPILFVGNIGNPSAGKSPAIDALAELLTTIERDGNTDYNDRRRRHEAESEAAAIRRKAWQADVKAANASGHPLPALPANADPGPVPTRRRLVLKDTTVEKAGELARDNPLGLLVMRDELAGWCGGMDKYGGGGDRPFWLEAYGGRPHVVDRVKHPEPISISALSIGIIGGIQPDRLASMLLAGDDDGLAARFLYFWPERRAPSRPSRQHDAEGAKDALARLRTLPLDAHDDGSPRWRLLPFDEEAATLMQQWRLDVAEHETEAAGLFLSWLGKLPGMAARLALVLEYLWWCGDAPASPEPRRVSEKAIHAAGAFLDGYALPMARRAFGDAAVTQSERDAATLARWLQRQKPVPERLNARELYRAKDKPIPSRDPARYEAALQDLEEAGWVRRAPARSGIIPGKRRSDWEVNPALRRQV